MQTEDGGLGPPVKGVNLVFLWVIVMEEREREKKCIWLGGV